MCVQPELYVSLFRTPYLLGSVTIRVLNTGLLFTIMTVPTIIEYLSSLKAIPFVPVESYMSLLLLK